MEFLEILLWTFLAKRIKNEIKGLSARGGAVCVRFLGCPTIAPWAWRISNINDDIGALPPAHGLYFKYLKKNEYLSTLNAESHSVFKSLEPLHMHHFRKFFQQRNALPVCFLLEAAESNQNR